MNQQAAAAALLSEVAQGNDTVHALLMVADATEDGGELTLAALLRNLDALIGQSLQRNLTFTAEKQTVTTGNGYNRITTGWNLSAYWKGQFVSNIHIDL